MKVLIIKVNVDDEISYRDIERSLNQLDAETELIYIGSKEEV